MWMRWAFCVIVFASSNLVAYGESWTLTGELRWGRAGHTSTVLLDGTVLVAGGWAVQFSSGYAAVPVTEIFNPATGRWSGAGNLNTPRYAHTATLLLDGRVLVAGGMAEESPLGELISTEIFDPTTGAWTLTGNLNKARNEHTATLLPDGRVLVVGAGNSIDAAGEVAEVYDPATGSWTITGSMVAGRTRHTATLLSDGRVLVAGGYGWSGSDFETLDRAELYDPSSGTWSPASNMNTARERHSATRHADGRVLVVGGMRGHRTVHASTEVYDPLNDEWTASGQMHTPRILHTATLLPTGRILVVAGMGGETAPYASSEVYEPESGLWYPGGDLQTGRFWHTASLLLNGQVLVVSGVDLLYGQMGAGITAELRSDAPILYPQLALGGGFEDILFITNQSHDQWEGSIQLNGGDWPPDVEWSLDGEDRTGESSIPFSLDQNETKRFVLGREGPAVAGWLEIHAESGSDLRYLATAYFYNFSSGGQLKASCGVAPATPELEVRFPAERSGSTNTGVAIRKTQSPIQFRLYDDSGVMVEEFSDQFEGAKFVDELFSDVPDDFIGSVELVASRPFYVTILRQDMTPDGFQLTSIPATPVP